MRGQCEDIYKTKEDKGKLEKNWPEGIWVGRTLLDDSHIVLTPDRPDEAGARTARRRMQKREGPPSWVETGTPRVPNLWVQHMRTLG